MYTHVYALDSMVANNPSYINNFLPERYKMTFFLACLGIAVVMIAFDLPETIESLRRK